MRRARASLAVGSLLAVALVGPGMLTSAGADDSTPAVPIQAAEDVPKPRTLTDKQADAADRVSAIGDKYPGSFGGSWWDHEAGGVVAAIKWDADTASSLAKSLEGRVVSTEAATYTVEELQQSSIEIGRELGPDLIASSSVDERSNGVVVEALKDRVSDVSSWAARRATTAAAVPITKIVASATNEHSIPASNRQNDVSPFSGGIGWHTGSQGSQQNPWSLEWLTCTMGFSMQKNGSRFLATAGHCTADAFPTYRANAYVRTGSGSTYTRDIATHSPQSYPNTLCIHNSTLYPATYCVEREGDAAGYAIDGGLSNTGNIVYGKNIAGSGNNMKDLTETRKNVTSVQTTRPSEGTQLCFSGGKTGLNCGFAVSLDFTNYWMRLADGSLGYITGGVGTSGNYGSNPVGGDSGAPWFRDFTGGVKAVGLHSGVRGSTLADNEIIAAGNNQNYNGAMRLTWIGSVMEEFDATVVTN